MYYKLWFLLHLVSAACSSVTFQDCGSAYDLEEVNIAGCGRSLPCYITLGEATPVTVHFYADFTSVNLDQKVVININYIDMKTEVTPEPCEIADCPVPTDCETSFKSVMKVPKNIALNSRGWLRWRVFNEKGVLVLCYSVMVQTQNPLQKLIRENLRTAVSANFSTDIATIDFTTKYLNLLELDDVTDDESDDDLTQDKEAINSDSNRHTLNTMQ